MNNHAGGKSLQEIHCLIELGEAWQTVNSYENAEFISFLVTKEGIKHSFYYSQITIGPCFVDIG